MSLILSGSDGLSDIDGTAATPAIRGTDANTGIFFPAADTIAFSEGGTEVARFDANGRLGIGTTSPAFNVQCVNTAGNSFISAVSSNSTTAGILLGDTDSATVGRVEYNNADNAMLLFANGSERMRIASNGYVGIGTSSPAALLHLSGTDQSNVRLRIANVNGRAYELVAGLPGANNDDFSIFDVTASATRMHINSSGALILVGSTAQKATGTTWSNPSDERLKDNIRDYSKGTAELMQVRVREWEYNGKGGTVEGTKGLGVVADEVMVVLPDTVENYEAKLNADDEEVTAIKKFDATEITWLLVKTVQEQQAMITELKATVDAQAARIAALEAAP